MDSVCSDGRESDRAGGGPAALRLPPAAPGWQDRPALPALAMSSGSRGSGARSGPTCNSSWSARSSGPSWRAGGGSDGGHFGACTRGRNPAA
jgi:hypothetical protein